MSWSGHPPGVGNAIYGQNEDTLESLIATRMEVLGQSLTVVEGGLGSELVRRLERAGIQTNALIQPTAEDETTFKGTLENHARSTANPVCAGSQFHPRSVAAEHVGIPDHPRRIV